MLKSETRQKDCCPAISVISPVRNERLRISKSLESLLSQSFHDIEHIIVDGVSTDGTLAALEEYAAKAPYPVKIIRNVGGGVYAALNAGIAEAKGRYVATLHGSDALTSPEVLEKAVQTLESSKADILYGDLHYVNSAGKTVRRYNARRFHPRLLKDGFMPPHPTVITRREVFDVVGRYSTRYEIAGDFDWLCRAMLIRQASTVYLPLDMVEMSTDGISCRWSSRLWGNNRDKYLSLRDNGLAKCPLRLLRRYLYL